MSRTLIICKPDAVERGLLGEIIGRFEKKGLRLVAAELRHIDRELAKEHYIEHEGRSFYPDLMDFITRSPSFVMVLESRLPGAWLAARAMIGETNPAEARPGTIRGDFGVHASENLVHGSDSPEAAAREIALFFPELLPEETDS